MKNKIESAKEKQIIIDCSIPAFIILLMSQLMRQICGKLYGLKVCHKNVSISLPSFFTKIFRYELNILILFLEAKQYTSGAREQVTVLLQPEKSDFKFHSPQFVKPLDKKICYLI